MTKRRWKHAQSIENKILSNLISRIGIQNHTQITKLRTFLIMTNNHRTLCYFCDICDLITNFGETTSFEVPGASIQMVTSKKDVFCRKACIMHSCTDN